ncbi:MAG: DUF721 domain-containing protein [Myxococcales bacterium]|nr:DUF721 domain-containing protein [Myxococcales bacterium]
MRAPERLANLVTRLFEGTDAPHASSRYHRATGRLAFEVFKAFDHIGPPLTDHAEPASFRKGKLTLTVRSSAWLTELAMMRSEIKQRLNSRLAKQIVEDVRLVLGSPKRLRPQPAPKKIQLSPSQQEKVESWAAGLINDRVREAFERAASRSLEAGPVGQMPYSGPAGPRVLAPVEDETQECEDELSYGYGNRAYDRWRLRKPKAR